MLYFSLLGLFTAWTLTPDALQRAVLSGFIWFLIAVFLVADLRQLAALGDRHLLAVAHELEHHLQVGVHATGGQDTTIEVLVHTGGDREQSTLGEAARLSLDELVAHALDVTLPPVLVDVDHVLLRLSRLSRLDVLFMLAVLTALFVRLRLCTQPEQLRSWHVLDRLNHSALAIADGAALLPAQPAQVGLAEHLDGHPLVRVLVRLVVRHYKVAEGPHRVVRVAIRGVVTLILVRVPDVHKAAAVLSGAKRDECFWFDAI